MKKIQIFFLLFLFVSISINAQKTLLPIKKLPKSIYVFSYFPDFRVNNFSTQKSLTFPSYDFVFVRFNDLESNSFSLNLKNMWKKPTRLIYDDYARYNQSLAKDFFRKFDPTRWNSPPHRQ